MDYAKKVDLPSPPTFLLKTYMMVDDPTTDGIISWNMDGSGFVVWRLAEFARDLLPTIFKHCNFASFVRQLNTYEFHKVSLDRWEFSNRLFRRGATDQLHEICRKKPMPNKRLRDAQLPKAPSRFHPGENGGQSHFPSASMQYGVLADENKRLQQEKDGLSSELFAVKKRFDKLLDLATDYGQNSESEKRGPKIFGVSLGIRR